MEKLFNTYNKIEPDILNRITEFKSVWKKADEKSLFQELAFCLLTPQSKAENAWKTIIKLTENQMKEFLNKIRIPLAHLDFIFWYNKTKTIFK